MGDALSRAIAHAAAAVPGDGWLSLITTICNGLIALACLSLAGTGAYILAQRRDFRYRRLLALAATLIAGLGVVRLLGLGAPEGAGDLANALARLFSSAVWVLAAGGVWLLLPRLARRADTRKLDELAGQLKEETADRIMISERLRITHEMNRAIIQGSPLAILTMDRQRRITSWNPAAERIYGYSQQELLGKEFPAPPDDPQQVAERINYHSRVMAGETLRDIELPRNRKDGTTVHVRFHANPLYDAAGDIRGMVAISEDITQLRRDQDRTQQLQNELAHVARVSAMGQMSAAIAHELNQPLTAVANYVKAAQRLLAAPDDERLNTARDVMEKAAGQAIRAGGIIRNLRGFVEKRESEKTAADINEIITTSLALSFIHSTENDVQVTLALDENLPPVAVDRVQIQQVLTNLIRNAAEAMAESPVRHLFLSSALAEDGFVRLLVRDSGPGLSPEVAARLFQPFTTTKSAGMGVGLAICQSIIEGHDGTIRALDEGKDNGGGACFEIRLPLEQEVL